VGASLGAGDHPSRRGRPAESEAALRELIDKHGTPPPIRPPECHAARGEADLAFECLERAYDASDPGSELDDGRTVARLAARDRAMGPFLRKMGSLIESWAKPKRGTEQQQVVQRRVWRKCAADSTCDCRKVP
jgi:hypothetical protein